MKPACYLRVSSKIQADANGTEMQRLALANWLRGATVDPDLAAVWFEDLAVSGKSMNRPQWNAMLERVRAKEFDCIVVYDLSRAGRTLRGLLEWLDEMGELGVRVVFVKDQIDLNTATGKLIISIMGAVAEYVRKLTADRIGDGVRAKIAAGGGWGGGKVVDPSRHGCSKLTPEQVATAMARIRDGAGVREVAAEYGVAPCTMYRHRARMGEAVGA